jgi:tight adherence protein C
MSGLQLIVPIVAALSIVLVFAGLAFGRRSEQQVQERLTQYGTRPKTLEEIELSQPFSQRVIMPLVNSIARLVTRFAPQKSMEAVRRNLELAGNPNGWGPSQFLAVRGLAAIIVGVLVFLLLNMAGQPFGKKLMFALLLALLGFQYPVIWLGGKISKRKHDVIKALPDALDLLTISVEAGLGFDAALHKVTEKWDNALTREFKRAISEIRMGRSRRDALRDLVNRTDVPDVNAFIAAIIQADQLGVSVANVLHVQAEQMRLRRRQRAEEQAHKAPVKMVFPMVLLIFPAMYVIILGPAIPTMLKGFGIK